MIRRFSLLVLASAALAAPSLLAQEDSPTPAILFGRIVGRTYYSPTGAFTMPIPVVAALGGTVSDTENDVLFQDPVSTYVTVWINRLDAAEYGKLDVEGIKQYLQDYFQTYLFRSFFAAYPGAKLEKNARFQPRVLGGAFYTFVEIPGGSAFFPPGYQLAAGAAPVAKRGNIQFLHDGYIYVISMELAERVTHAYHYSLSTEEEDILLRDRLTKLAESINFLTAPHQ